MNNLNPRFSTSIKMDFIFEAMQELKLVVCDHDATSNHDFLVSVDDLPHSVWAVQICSILFNHSMLLVLQGTCHTNVGHLMASPGSSITLKLMDYRNKNKPAKSRNDFTRESRLPQWLTHPTECNTGSAKIVGGKQKPATISLHAGRLSHNNDEIQFQFAAIKLVHVPITLTKTHYFAPQMYVHPCFAFRPIRTVCSAKATPSTPFQRGGKARLIGYLASPPVRRRVY